MIRGHRAQSLIVITTILGQFRSDDVDAIMDEITEMAGENTSIGRKVARPSLGAHIPEVLHVATNGAEAYVGGQIAAVAVPSQARLATPQGARRRPGEVGVIIYGPKGEELTHVVPERRTASPSTTRAAWSRSVTALATWNGTAARKPKSPTSRPPTVRAQGF